jgi:Bacterial mobilisation protein (MobC)
MYSDRKGKARVALYFNEEDLLKIDEKAKLAKMDRSKLIRKLSLEGDLVIYDFKSAHDLIYEINKIGVNVNQLAKKANEIQSIYKSDIDNLQREYENLCHMLNQFLLELPSTKA